MLHSAVLCILLLTNVYGSSDDVCFSLNRGPDDTNNGGANNPLRGFPGKQGPKGSIGPRGPQGLRGKCRCNPSEFEELRDQLRQLQDSYCTVGMRERRVKDEDITASSQYDEYHPPHAARLDNQYNMHGNTRSVGCWVAGQRRIGTWIQVDLKKPTRLTGVITQGRPTLRNPEWVTRFKIAFGNSTDQLQVMRGDDGNEITFEGNVDNNSYSTNKFPQTVLARYVRLLPQAWHNMISVRMEYLTC